MWQQNDCGSMCAVHNLLHEYPDRLLQPYALAAASMLLCSYEYMATVASYDIYDGLNTAMQLFVDFTISKFAAVKELHVIILVITLVASLLFLFKLLKPYVHTLHTQCKIIAGIMSLLPPEFDIESVVKTQVLGMRHEKSNGGLQATSFTANFSIRGNAASIKSGSALVVPNALAFGPSHQHDTTPMFNPMPVADSSVSMQMAAGPAAESRSLHHNYAYSEDDKESFEQASDYWNKSMHTQV